LETVLELQLIGIRQAFGKEDTQVGAARQRERKCKSLVDFCVKILTDEKRPVHVDELVEILRIVLFRFDYLVIVITGRQSRFKLIDSF
jgi:hypothetical protein